MTRTTWAVAGALILVLVACSGSDPHSGGTAGHGSEGPAPKSEGPHGGRLLTSDDFEVELAILIDELQGIVKS